MLVLQKSIKGSLFLLLICVMHTQIIRAAAHEHTRNITAFPSREGVQKYLAEHQTGNQSPLLMSSDRNQIHHQKKLNIQPLGCCALIIQGSQQLKSEWNNSVPYFQRFTWPPAVDRSHIHPDIIECSDNSKLCIAVTCCCPCTIGYAMCKNYKTDLTVTTE